MTVRSYLAFVAQLRGVSSPQVNARVDKAEEQTALREADQELISSLSHGYRQRLGVAQALVHNPALLILDEPTGGLDPVQIVEMRRLILGLKGEHTILISSHILSEISQTCDRLLIIQAGEIVAQGTEQELATRLGGAGHIELEIHGLGERAVEVLRAVPGVERVSLHSQANGVAVIRVEAPLERRPELVRALVQSNIDLLRLERISEKLESIFLKLTQGKTAS
jgi:ABC-2 type transport system ATP-binding protein